MVKAKNEFFTEKIGNDKNGLLDLLTIDNVFVSKYIISKSIVDNQ